MTNTKRQAATEDYFFSQDYEYSTFESACRDESAHFDKVTVENKFKLLNESLLKNAVSEYLRKNNKKVALIPAEYESFDFGDAWFKSYAYRSLTAKELAESGIDLSPFTADQMEIENAGSHPGGNAVWLSPSSSLNLIPIRTFDDFEDFADSVAQFKEGENDFQIISIK